MLCVPVLAKNTESLLKSMKKAGQSADVLEIRLDTMDHFDLTTIIQTAPKPVLITYRSREEGGAGSADPETKTSYLLTALQCGADMVDLEFSLPDEYRKKVLQARGKSKIIISKHIPQSTPPQPDLEKLLKLLAATGANIVKIVTQAEKWEDNLRVLHLISLAQDLGLPIISFCMGRMGRISRIASHLMGGYMSFASLEKGQESAGGQLPVNEMKRVITLLEA